jgi:predicted SprT family Zn-dependent metalloprotease
MLDSRGLNNRVGDLAVELLVIHEFAHVLVYQFADEVYDTYNDKNGKYYTNIRPHGKEYQEVYAMLLDTYATEVI